MPPLVNTPTIYCGGKIFNARLQWYLLSSDKWIHDVVHGKLLVFVDVPMQRQPPGPLFLSPADRAALDTAMVTFIERNIVELCLPGDQGFISNVFPTLKKDGTARVILNLKELNNHVEHIHF